MGSIAVAGCHLDAWAASGMKRKKWMRCVGKKLLHCGGGVLQLFLQLQECLNMCLPRSEQWWHTGIGEGADKACVKRRQQKWSCCYCPPNARLHLAVTLAVTAHGNCDNFSISISKLASEHIFKPPSRHSNTVIRYTYVV